jgi:hypothetical protein
MLRLATCTVCGTGNVGIRVSASGKRVVGMCDECDAVWLDHDLRDGPHFPQQPELPCPDEGSSLRDPPARWATTSEAVPTEWAAAVIEETQALG